MVLVESPVFMPYVYILLSLVVLKILAILGMFHVTNNMK